MLKMSVFTQCQVISTKIENSYLFLVDLVVPRQLSLSPGPPNLQWYSSGS